MRQMSQLTRLSLAMVWPLMITKLGRPYEWSGPRQCGLTEATPESEEEQQEEQEAEHGDEEEDGSLTTPFSCIDEHTSGL